VVDDYSEDNTEEVVTNLAKNDKRVVYDKSHNDHTVANSRNRGIELAKGEFVGFIDSDDLWKKDKLQKQLPLFDDLSVGFVCSLFETVDIEGNVTDTGLDKTLMRGEVLGGLLTQNFGIAASSVVVRKSVIDEFDIRQQKGRQGTEDWDFWLNIARVTNLDYIDEALIQRRYHGEGISRNLEMMYSSGLITIREFRKKLEPSHKFYKAGVDGECFVLNNFASWLITNGRFAEAKERLAESYRLSGFNFHTFKVTIKYILKKLHLL
jgi:glycosyltransferase involved in cell wall biosynthesis